MKLPLSLNKKIIILESSGNALSFVCNVHYYNKDRRGNKVFVGKVNHFEVDFVAQNSKGIEYYQVALTVRDEKTLQRELRHLQAIQELP